MEAAVSCPGIHVCAFEYKEEAVDLIRANCEKARTEAVTIVPGKAPETFAQVSVHRPDRAFIGGTTGQMREILDELFRLNPDIRIVINLIALESLTVLMSYLKERGIEAEILSMQIAKAEKISYHWEEMKREENDSARGIKSGRESYKRERCKECKIRFCTNGGNHGIRIPAGACSHLWGR